jgi:acyl-CoA synthetase (AMP-forming)/AMP-acid ligase II
MTVAPSSDEENAVGLADVVTTPEREAALLKAGWWDDVTISDRLSLHAHEQPEAIAVVDPTSGDRATFARLAADAARVAAFLGDSGVEPGEVVALQLPNWYSSIAIALGCLQAGAVVNPMLPIYRSHEIRHMLHVGRAKVIFTPSRYRGFDYEEMIESMRGDLPRLTRHVVVGPDSDVCERLFGRYHQVPQSRRGAGEICELMFTSGTEAEPKAIMHSERTLNASARATTEALGITASDVVWMPAPIGHATGFNHGMRLAVYHGLKLVLQDIWDPFEGARLVSAEHCTHTLLATTFLRDLIGARRAGADDVSSLRLFGCGGAPVTPGLVREAEEVGIGCLRLYGATEVLVATWNRPASPLTKRLHTEGPPLDGVELAVRDDGGRPLVGEPGELFVRSPSGCLGFFHDPVRTSMTFGDDGFIRSGDLGVLDEEGFFTIAGRKKEIIIRGGLNIAPREIEDLLADVQGVRQVAVVGLPDDRLGEITCACVVLEPNANLSLEAAVEHLKAAGLATFKLPQRLEIVDMLPTTATGKIRKQVLVARLLGQG